MRPTRGSWDMLLVLVPLRATVELTGGPASLGGLRDGVEGPVLVALSCSLDAGVRSRDPLVGSGALGSTEVLGWAKRPRRPSADGAVRIADAGVGMPEALGCGRRDTGRGRALDLLAVAEVLRRF